MMVDDLVLRLWSVFHMYMVIVFDPATSNFGKFFKLRSGLSKRLFPSQLNQISTADVSFVNN